MSVGADWNIFEVFIGSPGDLETERNAVEQAIQQWNASVGQTMRDPEFKENQVFRVFVELPEGQQHRSITDNVIAAHEQAPQVVPLTVSRERRIAIDQKFPGLCTALDEGFGLVLFVRSDASKVAIVHQGLRDDFTFAMFDDQTNVVKHLMALTYEVYRTSNEYQSNESLKKEIDSLFRISV
jgi:hypothetical protein